MIYKMLFRQPAKTQYYAGRGKSLLLAGLGATAGLTCAGCGVATCSLELAGALAGALA